MRKGPRLRVVITGAAGGQAAHAIRMLLDRVDDVDLVGVVEGHMPAKARSRARRYNAQRRETIASQVGRRRRRPPPGWRPCRVFSSIEAAIEEVEFDLVIVCSRPEDHAREVNAALRVDKCVLAEKPPTKTLEEALEIAAAERESNGWVAWMYQLYWQWRPLIRAIRRGELGVPLVIEAIWVRGLVAEGDLAGAEAIRLGQRGRPMVDLCHMLEGALSLVPGCTPLTVLGFSVSEGATVYETLTATVAVEWEGQTIRVQLRIVCGFNIPLPGMHTLEEVLLSCQGTNGLGTVRGLVDERVVGGLPLAPEDYLPKIASAKRDPRDGEVEIGFGAVTSPQPPTVSECLSKTLDWALSMIGTGEAHSGGGHAVKMMQVIDAFDRSCAVGQEVAVTAVTANELAGRWRAQPSRDDACLPGRLNGRP
jgi:predicted dehydrogenase